MSIECFVTNCNYVVHDEYWPDDLTERRINEQARMLDHLTQHINNIIKEMKPRVEDCPDHPGAPKWATGAPGFGYRYTCGWTTPDAHCARSLAAINY